MRDRLLVLLALLGFLLICLAVTASRPPSRDTTPLVYGTPSHRISTPSVSPTPQSTGHPPTGYHLSLPHWLLVDTVWLLAALGLGLLIWGLVRWAPSIPRVRRRRRQLQEQAEAPPGFDRTTQDRLARTFSDALAGVGVGDSNRAIVACWIRLEQIAEDVGFARQQWETSTELVTRWLGGADLPIEPLARLAELYREARYSGHAMSRDQIELARSTLTRLRLAFQQQSPQPTPAPADLSEPIDHD